MLHNYESSVDEKNDEDGKIEPETNARISIERITEEHIEALDRLGYDQAVEVILNHAEKPCVTSVAGHSAHGCVLAAPVNIGAKEYLLKEVTQLANGVKLDPTKITMDNRNDFLEHFTLFKGTQVTSMDVGMILSTGCGGHILPVYRQVNPVVLSYGDAVHNSWEADKGEISAGTYDYLRPQLMCFLKELQCNPIDGGILRKQYKSVAEGMIHAFLYSNVVIVNCYGFKSNLPYLLHILVKDFNFEVLFRSVEHIDVIFAHTVFEEAPRYVLILSDEPRMALLSTILLVLPLLNTMSGRIRTKMAAIKTTCDLKLQENYSFIFGELRLVMLESNEHLSLQLENVEDSYGPADKPDFFERPPIPRGSNILLQLPPAVNQSTVILPAGSTVNCIVFGSLI